MQLRRRKIDNSIEEKILTGLITNTVYCKDVIRMITKDTFINPYSQTISKWCIDYFKKYNKAPEKHIQDIFELEKIELKDEERNLISSFLSKLSNQYEVEAEFNIDYLKDKTIQYIKKQSMKVTAERIQHLLELDKIEDAEKELSKYKQVAKETSGCFNPFTDEEIKRFFSDMEDKSNFLMKLDGALGQLLGEIERHWLIGILAPSKRGKSFWEQEFAVQALMNGKKVFIVSLEMDKNRVKKRLYKRLTGFIEEKPEELVYPCFDCLKNQNDFCKKRERTNQIRLTNADGVKPTFFDKSDPYRICTACRGKKDFAVGTWFTTIKRDAMKQANTLKIIRGIRQAFGDKLRVKAYPAFAANVHDIMSALEELELTEDFVPDVIIIDYADILAPEDHRVVGRERIDETWKTLKRLADENHCLVVTASQSNRGSFKKKYVEEVDIAEDIRKIANSDLFIALNQTKQEKKEGVMRVNVIAARDEDFNTYLSCLCL